MLSLASVSEFPTFTNYKISITLLIFPKCRASAWLAMAKLQIIFGVEKFIRDKTYYYNGIYGQMVRTLLLT